MRLIVKYISIFKTIKFNLIYFPINIAFNFPVYISRNTLLNKLGGKIRIEGPIKRGMILIGFGFVPVFDRKYSRTIWNIGKGVVIFKGSCLFGHGTKIGCGGKLTFGKNFTINAESLIICEHEINFGDNVVFSWDCQIMDTDYHKIFEHGKYSNPPSSINFGNNIWIGSRVNVLKGVTISDNSVIASGSVVTKKFNVKNILIAGVPAKVIKENIEWKQ